MLERLLIFNNKALNQIKIIVTETHLNANDEKE